MTLIDQNTQAFFDVAYLAYCAVREIIPDSDRISQMDLDLVYQEASRQFLAACCAFALESAGVYTEDFTQAKAISIRRAIFMDQQRKEVLDRLEEAGIWYLPLKGVVLKDYYPSVGMREMSDNDILFDASRIDDMRAIMADLGFVGSNFDDGGAHDCFYKEPIFNFEMHRVPFDGRFTEGLNAYYENNTDRLLPDEDKSFGYHFTLEDFYLYSVAHEYKHYNFEGMGLRACIDTYVCLSKMTLNMGYIIREAAVMGIDDFERVNRELSLRLANGQDPSEDGLYLLDYMRKAGAYGTLESRIEHKVAEGGGGLKGKIAYAFSRIFPPLKLIKEWHPFLYRHRVLLPLVPIVRLGKAFTVNRHKLWKEIKALCKS